jgi:hypothetical protein
MVRFCLDWVGPDRTNFLSDASPASKDEWQMSWEAIGNPERDAYEALSRIYVLFGVDVATNPYVDDNRVVSDRLCDA